MAATCEQCRDKIASETSAMRSAIKSLESRFGDMENQLTDVKGDVSELVEALRERPAVAIAASASAASRARSYSQREHSLTLVSGANSDVADDDDNSECALRRSLQRIQDTRAKRRRAASFF